MRFLETFQTADFIDTLVSLSAAFVLGTLIGAERQYRLRSAGLRTNVLVAVGAAAFVDLAMHLAGADGAVRVIAYVVSGIGFLGAGVISKEGANISGINTAGTVPKTNMRMISAPKPAISDSTSRLGPPPPSPPSASWSGSVVWAVSEAWSLPV